MESYHSRLASFDESLVDNETLHLRFNLALDASPVLRKFVVVRLTTRAYVQCSPDDHDMENLGSS